jgi:hypothetical protein
MGIVWNASAEERAETLALISGLPASRNAWSVGPRQVTLLIWSSTEERPVRLRDASRDESPHFWIVSVQTSGRVRKL